MAEILLSIELPDTVIEDIKKDFKNFKEGKEVHWFNENGSISIDEAFLKIDEIDDSFYEFGFYGIRK